MDDTPTCEVCLSQFAKALTLTKRAFANLLDQFARHRLGRENKNDINPDTPTLWAHLTRLSPITKPTTNLHNLIAHFHQLIGPKVDWHRPVLGLPVIR